MTLSLKNTIILAIAIFGTLALVFAIPEISQAQVDNSTSTASTTAVDNTNSVTTSDVTTDSVTTDTSNNTSPFASLLATLKSLMAQVVELQQKLFLLKNNVQTLSDNLFIGSNSNDVKKIQQLLATDPTIYPEGYTTGFFGPLTKGALERFQSRHGLQETGEVDKETKDLLETYLGKNPEGDIPDDFLKDKVTMKEVETEVCEDRENGEGAVCDHRKEMELEESESGDDNSSSVEGSEDNENSDNSESEDSQSSNNNSDEGSGSSSDD